MGYEAKLTKEADSYLRRLDRPTRARLRRRIDELEEDPYAHSKRLMGTDARSSRVRGLAAGQGGVHLPPERSDLHPKQWIPPPIFASDSLLEPTATRPWLRYAVVESRARMTRPLRCLILGRNRLVLRFGRRRHCPIRSVGRSPG